MSNERTIGPRITAWLEEEATGTLPNRVLDSVFEQTREARRRRSPLAGRMFRMPRSLSVLIAVGAAAIILVVAAALFGPKPLPGTRGPGITAATSPSAATSPVATPAVTPAATPVPSATPLAAAADVTSPIYGYTVHVPAGWKVILATAAWDGRSAVGHDDPIVDQLDPPQQTGRCQQAFLCGPINWAYARPWTGTLAEWQAFIDVADARDHPCPASPESTTAVEVDGTPAILEVKRCEPVTGILVVDAVTVRGGTAYVFYGQDQSRDRTVEQLDRTDFLALLSAVALP